MSGFRFVQITFDSGLKFTNEFRKQVHVPICYGMIVPNEVKTEEVQIYARHLHGKNTVATDVHYNELVGSVEDLELGFD